MQSLRRSGEIVVVLIGMMVLTSFGVACGSSDSPTTDNTAKELKTVKVALSSYQDMDTIYVGIEKGFYEEEGIELEITQTDWASAQELLIGGHVDIANSSDADVVLANAQGHDTTLAFPVFLFGASNMMFNPEEHNWKTFETFQETLPLKEAIRAALEQIQGEDVKIALSSSGSEIATFLELVKYAGLNEKDFNIIDIALEDIPPTLLSGSVDLGMGGIPQYLAVKKHGYISLIGQSALPSTIHHGGFAASRAWVDSDFDFAVKLQKVIIKTLDYIKREPDLAFPIISRELKKSGTIETVEDLKSIWNVIEFFPDSKAYYEEKVFSPDGPYYWEARWESVAKGLEEAGKIEPLTVPTSDLFYGLKIIQAIE